jgi:UDP-glucuronate 4-epimerase
MSLYAATKKSNELMAHAYSDLFNLPTTGLRFFTVYGPWGRPDMAMFLFTERILSGEPINVFGHGKPCRDFTYVDDIVEGVVRILDRPAQPDPDWDGAEPATHTSRAPWRVYNIGCQQEVTLMTYIQLIERFTGRKAKLNLLPMQPGDMPNTLADVSELAEEFDYRPQTKVEEGVGHFVKWYRDYYGV